jgi:hypothetical protein
MLKAVKFHKSSLILAGLIVNLLPLQVSAFSGDSLKDSLNRCAGINNVINRLACFDELAASIAISTVDTKALSKSDSTTSVVKNTNAQTIDDSSQAKEASVNAQQESDFAKEHLKKTSKAREDEVDHLELTVSKLKKLIRGEWKIYFGNNQIWQQKDTAKIRLKVGDRVIIEKGAMTAFYLKKVDTNNRIRVKRIQ